MVTMEDGTVLDTVAMSTPWTTDWNDPSGHALWRTIEVDGRAVVLKAYDPGYPMTIRLHSPFSARHGAPWVYIGIATWEDWAEVQSIVRRSLQLSVGDL